MKMTPKRKRSDSASAAIEAAQAAALPPLAPPAHVTVPPEARPFWDAIVTARPRDTWNDADLASAANLARVQHAIGVAMVGSDEHAKLTRLSMALSRAVAVHPVATVGRSADIANAAELERAARQDDDDDLIPTLRCVK